MHRKAGLFDPWIDQGTSVDPTTRIIAVMTVAGICSVPALWACLYMVRGALWVGTTLAVLAGAVLQ